MSRSGLSSGLITGALIFTVSQAAHAQGAPRDPWRISASMGVDETYSDNIALAPRGFTQSDFVTTLSPSLHIGRSGAGLTVAFDYQPQYLFYARGTGGSALRNYLDASAKAAVIENFLFIDAQAVVSQQNVSPFGTLAADSVNTSANRAETRSYSFGPSLRSRVGSDFSYSAGYHLFGSSSNNTAYSSSHSTDLYGNFQTSTSFRDLGVGGNFDRSEQSYGGANQIVTETLNANLTYVLQPTIRLHGSGGYDRNSYPATGQPSFSGVAYSLGGDWNPSRHTHLNADIGHRYFGPTANVSITETTPRLSLSAIYSRDQTTSSQSGLTLVSDPNYVLLDQYYRATIPDPTLRAQAVTTALAQAGLSTSPYATAGFLSNQIYVQRRFEVSVAFLGLRNTVTLDAYRSESNTLSNIDTGIDVFAQAQKFQQTGLTANWSHRLGPRTSANFTAQKSHNRAIQGTGDTRQRILTASINRQIQKNLSGIVTVRNVVQDNAQGVVGGLSSGSYRENAVLGSLRLTF